MYICKYVDIYIYIYMYTCRDDTCRDDDLVATFEVHNTPYVIV